MQITSGKFESELFAMTSGKDFAKNTSYIVPRVEEVEVGTGLVINLKDEPIIGLNTGDTEDKNEYGVAIAGLEADDLTQDTTDKKKFTIGATVEGIEVGDMITVSYYYQPAATIEFNEVKFDNRSSAMGEAVLVYPVYSDGSECSGNGIAGHVIMKVYRCRFTQQPGLDGSYKTASTYAFTLNALDSKREDGMVYSITYVKGSEFNI